MSRSEIVGTSLRAAAKIVSKFSRLVARSSLSSCSLAVGPTMQVPSTVGMTRIPLDWAPGTGKITLPGRPRALRSRRNSSPLRGTILKLSAPNSRETSSAYSPAALITVRAWRRSPVSESRV